MVEVVVNASWRLSRIEFTLPHSLTHQVMGYGEVLLQESQSAGPQSILQARPTPLGEGDPKTYGAMPSANVSRALTGEVLAETVEINGNTVEFGDVMDALELFFEKWRVEDADKPTGVPMPEAAALTPVPVLGELGEPPPHVVQPI